MLHLKRWFRVRPEDRNITYCLLLICIITLQVCFLWRPEVTESSIQKREISVTTNPFTPEVIVSTGKYQSVIRKLQELSINLTSDISQEETKPEKDVQFDCKYSCPINKNQSLVFKTPYRQKAFLTIGIPTTKRWNATYIHDTLQSLIAALTESDKTEVIILVFLADFEQQKKDELAEELKTRFEKYINSGLIQVIQAPESFYPKNDITRLTYGQSKTYVKWRSKQCYDFAYMFKYANNMSTYYMQIEDDVITKPKLLNSIKKYMKYQEDWICLEFSELGFIGKLYRTVHLQNLATLFMMFYSEQPVDEIYLYFNILMAQFNRHLKIPTQFQHLGVHSSFKGKLQRLKDRYFDFNLTETYKGDNPPADIFTTLKTYHEFLPKLAYSGDGFFWGKGAQTTGSTFTVIFKVPQVLKRVVVVTGSSLSPRDQIYDGQLEAGLTLVNKDRCENNILIGNFINGKVDNSSLLQTLRFKVTCLTITITKDNPHWASIFEIAVFVK